MRSILPLADVLQKYVRRSTYTPDQLAKLSGIPKATIVNWLAGHVKKPRRWQDLARLSSALHLTESEATEVLQAGGYPSVVELLAPASSKTDADLLSPWAESAQMRFKHAPFQAIADLAYFVGREQILQDLKAALIAGRHVTLYSLEGMPGVGKTVLAAHVAYQLRSYFPDGVLWARLDTSDTMSILSAFANAYGRDVSKCTDLGSRSQVVREVLANKRALVVLDNAQHSEEVQPLLPPTGTCAVIITTRHRDLSASRVARRFQVNVFDTDTEEAFGLFVKILGEKRAQDERPLLLKLADLLGHLPLAVDIAASRLAFEPDWSVSDFLERISLEKSRLSNLVYENQSIQASFNLSHDALPAELKPFFAALGVFGGHDFGVDAVAYVTSTEHQEAESHLRYLYGLSLVQQARPRRYRLHPLLRDYARDRLVGTAAITRMVEFFVQYVEEHRADYGALDLEIDNTSAALHVAFDRGMNAALMHGANALSHYLDIRGLYTVARSHLLRAQEAAKSQGDNTGLAAVLVNLGRTSLGLGDYDQSERLYREALAIADKSDDSMTMCASVMGLGVLAENRGNVKEAEQLFHDGLARARAIGDRRTIGTFLEHVGRITVNLGDFARGDEYYQDALALAHDVEDRELITRLLLSLGVLAVNRGKLAEAEKYYQEALLLTRDAGFHDATIVALENYASVTFRRADHDGTERLLREALALARKIGNRERISYSLMTLGALASHRGNYDQAEPYLLEGLSLARAVGHKENMFYLLTNLGEVISSRGNLVQAEERYLEALALARDMGHSWSLGYILNALGELRLKQQKLDLALSAFEDALGEAQKGPIQELVAQALYGLARVAWGQSNAVEARRQGVESLSIFESIGHYAAKEVGRWLNTIP